MIKLTIKCIGFIALALSYFGCQTLDLGPKQECCSWTDDYNDFYKYCEDDVKGTGYTWSYLKSYILKEYREYKPVCKKEAI